MKPAQKGLYVDCSEVNQPPGSYRFAKNIVVDPNSFGIVENENGFTNLNELTPYTLIGVVPVTDNQVVVFSTDNTDSEIGIITLSSSGTPTAMYAEVYNNTDLAFNTDYPIQGEYRVDVNNDRVVTWTDNLNTLRLINIDDTSSIDSIEDLNAFQDVINPSISSKSILQNGGSLPTGAVIPITKYKNTDGSETNWFVHDSVFYINDDSTALAFNEDDGATPGTITNKAISITLSDCDIRYDSIIIGYIRVVNNIVTAYEIGSRTVASSVSVIIAGSETVIDITLDEVLTPTANYNTVGTITQLAGQLYAANLTVEPIPDLQKYALMINIDYNVSSTNVISNTNSHKDTLPPVFMPGEVYAFYLGVELNKGGWAYYHIPGRTAVTSGSSDTASVTSDGLTYTRFQVENTSNRVGGATNMGYWSNSGETYPNDSSFNATSLGGQDLRNTSVLHHRFPTTDYLVSTYYSGDSTVGVTNLPRLGISVSNVNIPAEIQSNIKRWKIFFAKKSTDNSIVVGDDLLLFSAAPDTDTSIRWSTGGNWDMEAESGTPGAWRNFVLTSLDTIRGHSLDLQQEFITPTYARFNYQLNRSNLNTDYTGFRSAGVTMSKCSSSTGQCASGVIDYTVPTYTTRSGSGFIKRLDNFAYLPANAQNGDFKTQYTEGCYVAEIYTPSTSFNNMDIMRLTTRSTGGGSVPNQFSLAPTYVGDIAENTMYMQYCRLLTTVHNSFTQQDLVPLIGYYSPSTTSGTFYGGDTFMCYKSFLTAAPQNANPDGTIGAPYEEGVRIWRGYIGYSRYNFNYRYQTDGDLSTYYHGKTDVRTLFSPTFTVSTDGYTTLVFTNESLNIVNYDTSMNSSNIYSVGTIYNPDIIEETELPNTIIWSPVQNEESKEFSWRSFPSDNRYVIPKNKGSITNIQGFNNSELLINTTNSFFRTRSDTEVQADTSGIYLKTSSIFSISPQELVSSETGYAGSRHKHGCCLTKAGYIFPDDVRGSIFLYNGESLEEISLYGMRTFFRDYMYNPDDNPYTSSGYTIGYDNHMKRIIITKKYDEESWTISYDPQLKVWRSYHDYIPDCLFSSSSGNLYSFNSNSLYTNNYGAKGTYYSTAQPSYIDKVFNPQPESNKIAINTNWQTEVYPNLYPGIDSLATANTLDYNTTCTHLTVRSADHCTGKVTLSRTSSIYDIYSANIRNQNRTWYFDDIRDVSLPAGGFLLPFYDNFDIDVTKLNTNYDWFDQRYFNDKYVTCRFEFDNSQNKKWLLLDVDTEFKLVV